MKTNLLTMSLPDLEKLVIDLGQPKFRAKQLFDAIKQGKTLDEISNIPKSIIEQLKSIVEDEVVTIIESITSKEGTIKYLFKLNDGNVVEGVFMQYSYGNTLCISTQVGCRMNCVFCASGIGGLQRDMTTEEILQEVLLVNKLHSTKEKRGVTNIVLMGTGEPLDNYDNVVSFLKIITSKDSINISPRNISLSTSGIVPRIYDLAHIDLPINLTISLHSPFDEIRNNIMPVNKAYNIKQLLLACKNYFDITKRRVIFEYLMIDDVNDRKEDAVQLAKLLKGFSYHVNLIRLNYVKEKGLRGTKVENIKKFMTYLEELNVSHTLRRSMGGDIEGACGQLRKRYMDNEEG